MIVTELKAWVFLLRVSRSYFSSVDWPHWDCSRDRGVGVTDLRQWRPSCSF